MRQFCRGANFLKHTPKLIILGTRNLQTFEQKTLINELLLIPFYLFNIRPKLHHQKWRKLCITLFRTFWTLPAACFCCSSSNLYPELCYKPQSIVTFTFIQNFDQNFVFLLNSAVLTGSVMRMLQNCVIFGVWFEQEKVDKKTNLYTKTKAYKLYSRVFGIFLPNVIKIDQCNFELYRFKFGAFFWDKCVFLSVCYALNGWTMSKHGRIYLWKKRLDSRG